MSLINELFSNIVQFYSTLPSYLKNIMFITMGIFTISTVIHTLLNALKKDVYIKPVLTDNDSVNLDPKILFDVRIDEPKIKTDIPVNCINCGAIVSESGICEYCGTDYNKSV